LRTEWKISKRQDLWNVVPSKVRNCYGFIFPLEDMISEMSVDQRNLWVDLAQNQLKKLTHDSKYKPLQY
jgi:lipopolysaccharide biosynthesis protein